MILFARDMIGSGNYHIFKAWASQSSWSNGNNNGDRAGLPPRIFQAGLGGWIRFAATVRTGSGWMRGFEAIMQAEDEKD